MGETGKISWFMKRTLSRDLMIGLTLMIYLVLSGFGLLYQIFHTKMMLNEIDTKANHISNEFSEVLSVPMWNIDIITMNAISKAYLSMDFIVGVRVESQSHEIIDHFTVHKPDVFIKKKTIHFNNRTIGSVEIQFSNKQIQKDRAVMIRNTAITILLVTIAIFFGIHFLMKYLMAIPLKNLIDGIKGIAEGEFKKPLSFVRQQDVNKVISEVNMMAKVIDTREKQLTRLRNYLKNIFDSMPSILVGMDVGGHVIQWNHEAEKITGVSSDDAIGKLLIDVLPQFTSEMKKIKTTILSHEIQKEERIIHTINGKIRFFDITFYPLLTTGVDGVVIRIDDVSERVRWENKISKAKEEAENANKAKSEFLANISHEIRTPLNAVTGFSELLSSLVSDKKQQSYLTAIKAAGKNLLTLINDILDLSKIEAGMMEIQCEPVEPSIMFREIDQIFKANADVKKLQFIIDIDKDMPPVLMLDEIRLRQVLFNLVGNALKFTEKGQIRLSAKKIYKSEDKGIIDLILSLEDTGVGIPKEDQYRIFESFRQQQGDANRKYGGTGLGLSISKRLIEIMNGEISVTSKVGKGSMFKIVLRDVKVSSTGVTALQERSFNIRDISFAKGKVLVVDDIFSNRELLRELLLRVKLDVLTAENGQESILLAKEYQPDIIIMDIKMPVMDGYEATKRIKKNPSTKDIPIIALTASALFNEKSKRIAAGFDGYLTKPVKMDNLLGELSKYLKSEEDGKKAVVENEKINVELQIENIKKSSALVDVLRIQIVPLCNGLKRAIKMSDVRKLWQKLQKYGVNYEMELLVRYGKSLSEYEKSYDIVNIKKIVTEFSEILEVVLPREVKNSG